MALMPILFCGCASFEDQDVIPAFGAPAELTAGFEDDTRTYVEDGKYLRWHEDDRITAFYGNTLNRQYKFKGKTGDNSGTFALVPSGELGTGNELEAIYAVYPYDENATITDAGVISLTLPATQSYAEDSFGKGANTMVAVTENIEDTFLAFKNACGYLKLKLYNADGAIIKSLEVKGNNGEKLAGNATATISFGQAPILTMSDDAADVVSLDFGEGVVLGTTADTATELWIVLPETTFEGGITITATDTEGGVFEKSTTNEVVIERNAIQPMAALEAEFPVRIPNNEIWYTATAKVVSNTSWSYSTFGSSIASHTFDTATGKGIITFYGDVTIIKKNAFDYCNGLTSITIPDSVTTIEEAAFHSCPKIEEFKGKFAEDSGKILVSNGTIIAFAAACGATDYTIPEGIATIGELAFDNCDKLKNITIGSNVTTIGNSAFNDCSGLNDIIIPDNVTTLAYWAFGGCNHLKSVTIGSGVTSIAKHAFAYCDELSSVYIKATNPPTAVPEYSVWKAFNYCSPLLAIYVPTESLNTYKAAKYWSDYADVFVGYNFENGATTEMPENNEIWYTATTKVTPRPTYNGEADAPKVFGASILSNEWDSTTGEGVITFSGDICLIGEAAFHSCTTLTSITIPNSVTSIGEDAFSQCTKLKSINIHDNIASIGSDAFWNCYALTDVIIGNNVTVIGSRAFYQCKGLKNIVFGEKVKSIGYEAFKGCTLLTTITIPQYVESIGSFAFWNCKNITTVYCHPTTPPTLGDYVFAYLYRDDNTEFEVTLYVPETSISLYQQKWKVYIKEIYAL